MPCSIGHPFLPFAQEPDQTSVGEASAFFDAGYCYYRYVCLSKLSSIQHSTAYYSTQLVVWLSNYIPINLRAIANDSRFLSPAVMFLFTYIPQMAIMAFTSGPAAPLTTALLVLSESQTIFNIISKNFVISDALIDTFDGVSTKP